MNLAELQDQIQELIDEYELYDIEPEQVTVQVGGHGVGTPREVLALERMDEEETEEFEGRNVAQINIGRAVS